MDSENEDYSEWLAFGIANGWISEPFDIAADPFPFNEGEREMNEDALYLPCLRLYGPRYFGVLSA